MVKTRRAGRAEEIRGCRGICACGNESLPLANEPGARRDAGRAVWYSTSMYARRDNDDDVIIAS